MTWKTRANIAVQICSALIFLHTNQPRTIHENLKPSKVLLDSNSVTKLTDLGIFHLMPQGKDMQNSYIISRDWHGYTRIRCVLVRLQLLTGRPVSCIVRDVRCAAEKGKLETILDSSGGEWPSELATQFTILALRCCEKSRYDRPDLVPDIWGVLEQVPKSQNAFHLSRKEVMKDPQIAADGFTYEAIQGWLTSGHNT